jgi:anti-sigma factor RsiW
MSSRLLTCKELIEFLWRYLEDELSPSERAEFDRHLATCPCCGTYLETFRVTVDLGHLAYADPDGWVPPEVPEEIVQGILAARRAGG